jgi:hypothetical protein
MCLVDVLGFMVEPEFQSFPCKLEFVSMVIRHGHGVRDARGGGCTIVSLSCSYSIFYPIVILLPNLQSLEYLFLSVL